VPLQVRALCTLPGGGVPATYLSSQQTAGDKAAVYRELSKARPTCKLLYVTPVRTEEKGDGACQG
jgi:superfamily II DNA helicase RecQ